MIAPATSPRPPPSLPRAKPRDYISFSAVRTYQSCPLRYFFKYIAAVIEQELDSLRDHLDDLSEASHSM
jgi:hypothetical protein